MSQSWFVDLPHTFGAPNARTLFAISRFINTAYSPLDFAGTPIGTYTADLTTQAIGITINKTFWRPQLDPPDDTWRISCPRQ